MTPWWPLWIDIVVIVILLVSFGTYKRAIPIEKEEENCLQNG